MPSDVTVGAPEQRILEMSMLLPADGAVTGWAALWLLRAGFFDGLAPDGRTVLPVPLVVGPGQRRRRHDGVICMQDRLAESEVRVRHGIRHTTAERATFDTMRSAGDLREAVVALDMASAAEVTSPARMRGYVKTRAGWDGVPLVRRATALADELSRSPNETRMRLIWVLDARLPRPAVNQPVWGPTGNLLGVADLFDVEAGVVGEYDGADHRGAQRHARDVAREERFRDAGLEYFKITGPDIADPALVAARMRRTRARAGATSARRRSWTTEPPPGWSDAPSLDAVLDLRDFQREMDARWEAETR